MRRQSSGEEEGGATLPRIARRQSSGEEPTQAQPAVSAPPPQPQPQLPLVPHPPPVRTALPPLKAAPRVDGAAPKAQQLGVDVESSSSDESDEEE
jgi:hypothetical protein